MATNFTHENNGYQPAIDEKSGIYEQGGYRSEK